MSETIELGDNDGAFILRGDGDMQMYVPQLDSDAVLPPHLVAIVAIALRYGDDPAWVNDLMAWMEAERAKHKGKVAHD